MNVSDNDIENSKRFIINEIKRTAEKNGGQPLGMIGFYKATGIKIADWRGKLWLRWSDAVKEAGLSPNKKSGPYDEEMLIEKFIGLMRELGHFPLSTELEKKGYHNRTFPSHMAFRAHWGSRIQQATRITLYCQSHKGLADILAMCEPVLKSQDPDFSVVLFRPNFMLASEGYPMKVHKNQRLLTLPSPPNLPCGASNQGTYHGVWWADAFAVT